jgi:stage II sporulation protein D
MRLLQRIFILAFFLCISGLAAAQRIPDSIIRVGLLQDVASFNLTCEGPYHLYELSTGNQDTIAESNDYLVKTDGKKITVGGNSFTPPLRLVNDEVGSLIRINGHRYRDSVLVTLNNGKITVINELGIEDYLCGILPREVSPAWPLESLKAQAVVSRTYALRNLRRHDRAGFDLCTQTHCQVYGGVEAEDGRSNAAVEATRGVLLVYDGQMAQTLFHASCGGHTENPNNVWAWDSVAPCYLEGVKDKLCDNSPHHRWENKVGADYIRKRLQKSGYDVGSITKIRIAGTNSSGRTKILKIKHSKGQLSIAAAKFRMAVDPWLIRSTLFKSIERKGDAFVFTGLGWGHGVGMCQWGAKEMAEKGRSYEEILKFFYPGTDVEQWEE